MKIKNKTACIIASAVIIASLTACQENIGNADGTTENTEVTTVEEITEITEIETTTVEEVTTIEQLIEEETTPAILNVFSEEEIKKGCEGLAKAPEHALNEEVEMYENPEEFLSQGIHSIGFYAISGVLIDYVGAEIADEYFKEFENKFSLEAIENQELEQLSIYTFCRDFGITKEIFLEITGYYPHLKYEYNLSEVFPEETE
jgi:hypothetical protein